jgi:hypothetical protein
MADAPSRPPPEDPPEFTPKRMVRWLEPRELLDAGMRVVLSGLFGAYADKRELQVALPRRFHHEYAENRSSIWVDYVADLGDGFNPTYAVASLLARRELTVGEHRTERGSLLVLGGDQVYPSANRDEYENRFIGPYRAALPCETRQAPPDMFAIPGNHDWYDGLTSFLRIFCQPWWIGGWWTPQARSYFAIELPHRWWLWGLDIQFDTYIDTPQLDYFARVREDHLREGDRVILVTGKPSWVKVFEGEPVPDSWRNLAFFEDEMIAAKGARLAVTISGDLHHYCRYEATAGGEQKITSGGGGAYLYPTHIMRDELALPDRRGQEHRYRRTETPFPGIAASRRMRVGALKLPRNAPGLGVLVGTLYALLAWALYVAVKDGNGDSLGDFAEKGYADLWPDALSVQSALVFVVFWAALTVYANASRRLRGRRLLLAKLGMGGVHALVHTAAAAALTLLALDLLGGATSDPPEFLVYAGLLAFWLLLGLVLGPFIFGLYLLVAHLLLGDLAEKHANEVFACQSIEGWKNFLRLHIGEDGKLTIYPIGLEKVPGKWRPAGRGAPEDPWFEPDGQALEPRLIEGPIEVT